MKKGILFLLLTATVGVNAQSLKDALYSGKLKTDTGTVLRKGEDLSSKIDTSRKIPVATEKTKLAGIKANPADTASNTAAAKTDNNAIIKDNTKLWKQFMDSLIIAWKTELMDSKKLKKGDYYITVDYEIGLDGQVSIKNIYPSPENKWLEEEVKERLTMSAPLLSPVMGSNGKPRKVTKRYNFTLTRD